MKPDWSQVTLAHVQQACEIYDTGAVQPKRPAQSTFLLLNGKTYPAKFIRGLAYRLATGVELDPSRDYSGGLETIRFFESLGLSTRHDENPKPEESAAAPTAICQVEAPPTAPQEHREPQKRALARLLRQRYGTVETEAEFPWLTVPPPTEMDDTFSTIFNSLTTMRGFTDFITPGKSLRCDFFVPGVRLIVEYDERQHFTLQRANSLEFYPPDLSLGFDREQWLTACRTIQATDDTPRYRDEQRAFYDSLRDILAARNGVRLIRLRYGTFDWTRPGAEKQLDRLLASDQVITSQPIAVPTAQKTSRLPSDQITKLALISHDYNVLDSRGLYDYSEHFARINKVCDDQGCDTILYSLYTWDRDSVVPRNQSAIFGNLAHVQRVIIEVGQPALDSFDHVEVWTRGQESPVVAKQRFATSSAPSNLKQAFIDDLDQRQIGGALLVLCGESNIGSLVRGSEEFYDPFGFADWLRNAHVRLILNPIHDYMRRYEMREKRRHYSLGCRTVISVWNKGKGKEAHLPWTVFHDGVERTAEVLEIGQPISDRPDIRVGIVDLASLLSSASK